jgi:Protein of unknown function (DUF3262)
MSSANWAEFSLVVRSLLGVFVTTWAAWQIQAFYRSWLARQTSSQAVLLYGARTFMVVAMMFWFIA